MVGHGSPRHSGARGVVACSTIPQFELARVSKRGGSCAGAASWSWRRLLLILSLAFGAFTVITPAGTPGEENDGRGKGFLGRLGGAWRGPLGSREGNEPAAPAVAASNQFDLRLRVTWGGGTPRAWQGELRLSQGELRDVVNLGREADDPGSIQGTSQSLQIVQPSAAAYGGCDVTVIAPATAELILELAPRDRPTEVRQITVRLAALVSQPHAAPLDEQQNRLHLARTPGDRLRVDFDRDSLVFQPGEPFSMTVQPHALGSDAATALRARVWLSPARGTEELWKQELDVRPAAGESLAAIGPLTVPLPEAEGAYDVHVELLPRRLSPALPLGRTRPLHQRTVQVVVVSPQRPPPDATPWKTLAEFEPAAELPGEDAGTSRWSDWIKRMPTLKPGASLSQGPLGNSLATRREHQGKRLVELAAGGWQAYPLPVNRVDEPHVLEIEYPADVPQTLGVSLVEPNVAGRVAPLGIDSGVDVGEVLPGKEPGWWRHRLLFWPRTRNPLVVLVNRASEGTAVYGRLAVLAGPARLVPPSGAVPPGPQDRRLAAALLDRPVFPENFGAGEAFDAEADGVWDDWQTFYQGAIRLVDYLKYAGYNSAVISVACEGSAIYPSQVLEPTPKYDSGMFFSGGHDPLRKDVLEMLFRLFDREGLKLIPAVQFAAPLPELERLRRQGGPQAVGLEWTGADGQTWATHFHPNQGLAPHYNLLDERVQAATLRVVDELADRYAHHASWQGLALQLGPDSYATLPGANWGYDDRTVARFTADTGMTVPGQGAQRFAERARFLQGEGRSRWLAWRATQASQRYGEVQRHATQRHPDSLLLLAGADLITSPAIQAFARPALPARQTAADVLLTVGLDFKQLAALPGVVPLRPYRSSPILSLASQGANLEWNRSPELDRLFAAAPLAGGLSYHESLSTALPSFDRVSPFGADKTNLWMATQFVRGDGFNRRRLTRCLAAADTRILVDGGWTLPLGGEDQLRPALEVFRALPAERCEACVSTQGTDRQALTVRQAVDGDGTIVYLLNDAPWPVTAEVLLDGPRELQAQPLGGATAAPPLTRADDGWRWRVTLGPHDLRAVRLDSPRATVRDWQSWIDPEVAVQLGTRIKEVRARANQLRSPQPLDVLANAGFELVAGDSAAHWLHARGAGLLVASDATQHRGGTQSLHLRSDKEVVWVRSESIPTPATGRLAVWAWVKARDPAQQAALRLALEGKIDGRTYYRYASVGGSGRGSVLQTEWTQYWFQIDDLPAHGLTDLRIGFDMMGAGEVWIDDVQLFDLWFYENERDELIKHIGLADFQLSNGRLQDCERFLEGYWPRFLQRHVPLDQRVVQIPARRPAGNGTGNAPGTDPADKATPPRAPVKTGWKERLDGFMPRRLW